MPYVRRNARGEIESVHRSSSPDALEYLDPTDRQISDFFGQPPDAPSAIDAELSMVLVEALDALLARGILSLDEFSREAQASWLRRKELEAQQEKRRFAASGFVEIIDDSTFGMLGGLNPDPGRS